MAYVLGFFAADGAMYRTNRGTHFISFEITDGDLLRMIQKLLKSDQLGLMQNKNKILPLPHVPSVFLGDFTRGYFDGDGHVWAGTVNKFNRRHSSHVLMTGFTSGSEKLLSSLRGVLEVKAGLVGGSLCFSSGAFRLQYATANSLRLYDFMYQRGDVSHLIYLERKYKIFQDAKASKEMRP